MIKEEIENAIEKLEQSAPQNLKEWDDLRVAYLGKKGFLNSLYGKLKKAPNEEKRELGQLINKCKIRVNELLEDYKNQVEGKEQKAAAEGIDLTLPPPRFENGTRHPINIVQDQLVDVFGRLGFDLAEGPEVVDEWKNFTALNMPEDHPARDMQDTFFVENLEKHVLRTHTSGVQVQEMLSNQPPIRTISPGMVFRKDNDATHSPFFHQIEGLYVDKNVSFADLKQTLYYFVKEVFGDGTDFRLRPSYFPFTEPSAEMDIKWDKGGKDDWMEILGCGMVDPAVLENCNIDAEKYSGFAFGIGIERIAMLKYGITDIRTFYENDVRFLSQFASE